MMASTGDDGSDADSVPDDVFQRSSSAAVGPEEELQYAQNPLEDGGLPQQPSVPPFDEESDYDQDQQRSESDEVDSDQDYDRENRFDGPASTWRFYTESERALAASLEQEQANDLSKHLFNAHARKAIVRGARLAPEVKHHHGKKHWIGPTEDGTLPWHPDAHWTAWPLRPQDVPRRGEDFGTSVPSREDERMTYKMAAPWRPSADLEEELQAVMLRRAKEQFRSREREHQSVLPSASHRLVRQSSPRKRKRSSGDSSRRDSSSQSQEELSDSHMDRQDSSAHQEANAFEMMIDDEDAKGILQPSIQGIVSKLDDLLAGLHTSRRGHSKEPTSARSRAKYERRRSRSMAKSKARTDEEDGSPLSDEPANIDWPRDASLSRMGSASAAPSPAARDLGTPCDEQTPKRKPPLNPRDWSEVLSVASLVGWDPVVVQRAAERCSSLFGESMKFSQLGSRVKTDIVSDENAEPNFVVLEEQDDQQEGLACPMERCPRHDEPWPLNKTWRWREHLKRSHKFSKGDIEKVEAGLREVRG